MANLEGGALGVFTGSGGPLTTIEISPGGGGGTAASFSSSGIVGYITRVGDIRTLKIGDGTFTEAIIDTSGEFLQFEAPRINDHIDYAFFGGLDELPLLKKGVYILERNGVLRLITNNRAFDSFGDWLSLNNHKQVAFEATFDGKWGIYTGGDPIDDKVLASGDDFFGSTVLAGSRVVIIGWEALNDRGQIAFQARLEDGTVGIYRADPIPRAVAIEIGATENRIHCSGPNSVAVLGSDSFDVEDVVVDTLAFNGTNGQAVHTEPMCVLDDVNADGYTDLSCRFVPGNGAATLTGVLSDGTPFEGTDSICIVP